MTPPTTPAPDPDHSVVPSPSRPGDVTARLDAVTAERHRESGDRLPPETVRQAVDDAHGALAANVTISRHLPVLATRQARRRLAASASPTQPTGGGAR